MDVEIGSFDGINFLRTLTDCTNKEVFSSEFIKSYLFFRWQNIKILM